MNSAAVLKGASLSVFLSTSALVVSARLTARPHAAPGLAEPRVDSRPVERRESKAPGSLEGGPTESLPRVEEYLRELETHQRLRTRDRAFEAAIVERRGSLLEHEDTQVRLAFARLLSGHRFEDTRAIRVALLEPLASEELQGWRILNAYLIAGCEIGPDFRRVILARIRQGLDSENPNARLNAARSLGIFGSPSMQRRFGTTCGTVDQVLFNFPDCEDTWRELIARLAEEDGPEAGAALGSADGIPFYPFLVKLLNSKDPKRREGARRHLEWLKRDLGGKARFERVKGVSWKTIRESREEDRP